VSARSGWRRATSPTFLVLALLCFVLPFIAVSCDSPGGYGRVSQGGTTSYTGLELSTGGAPQVTKDHLQPPPQQRRDRLDWQPLTVLAGLLVLGGVTASVTLRRRRGEATAAVTVAAAIVLGLAQLHTRSVLTSRVAEQTGLSQRDAAKHVATQYGFWLCLLLVLLAALAALIEVVIGRLRRGGRGPGPPPEPA
jgi:hypothetical protein